MAQDAIVCGSGCVGLTIAHTLAVDGWCVTVIDDNTRKIFGGSLNAYGVITLRDRPVVSPLRALLHAAFQMWPDFHMQLGLGSMANRDCIELVPPDLLDGHELLRENIGRSISIDTVADDMAPYVQLREQFVAALRVSARFLHVHAALDALHCMCGAAGVSFVRADTSAVLHRDKANGNITVMVGKECYAPDLVVWATGAWAHENMDPYLILPCLYYPEHVVYATSDHHPIPHSLPILFSPDGIFGVLPEGRFYMGSYGNLGWQTSDAFSGDIFHMQKICGYRGRVGGRMPILGMDPRGYPILWAYGFHRVGWTLVPMLPVLVSHVVKGASLGDSLAWGYSAITPQRFFRKATYGR